MARIIPNQNASTPTEIAANMKAMTRGIARATARATYEIGHEILNEAIPLTPMDTGDLRDSGYVSWKSGGGEAIEVEVGFGGAATPYALAVHEMPTTNNFQEPGTGPKYLERPFDKIKSTLAGQVAKRVASMMARNSAPRRPDK